MILSFIYNVWFIAIMMIIVRVLVAVNPYAFSTVILLIDDLLSIFIVAALYASIRLDCFAVIIFMIIVIAHDLIRCLSSLHVIAILYLEEYSLFYLMDWYIRFE